MEKARVRCWPTFTRHEGANLLGGAAHVQPYNCAGNISADLSRAHAGLPPGARSHVKAMVGALSLSLRLLDYLPGTPMCVRVRALARSLQISIAVMIVHRRWVRRAQPQGSWVVEWEDEPFQVHP